MGQAGYHGSTVSIKVVLTQPLETRKQLNLGLNIIVLLRFEAGRG